MAELLQHCRTKAGKQTAAVARVAASPYDDDEDDEDDDDAAWSPNVHRALVKYLEAKTGEGPVAPRLKIETQQV